MTATTAAVLAELRDADVRCHCGGDATGHHLGAAACDAPKITRTPVGYPALQAGYGHRGGPYGGGYVPTGEARGTCSTCGRPGVQLVTVKVCTAAAGHDLMPGIPLGEVVELRPHRTPGRGRAATPCPGRAVAETRYRFPAVDAMIRDYGPESVTR